MLNSEAGIRKRQRRFAKQLRKNTAQHIKELLRDEIRYNSSHLNQKSIHSYYQVLLHI